MMNDPDDDNEFESALSVEPSMQPVLAEEEDAPEANPMAQERKKLSKVVALLVIERVQLERAQQGFAQTREGLEKERMLLEQERKLWEKERVALKKARRIQREEDNENQINEDEINEDEIEELPKKKARTDALSDNLGQGQAGTIPSSFLGDDLNIAAHNANWQPSTEIDQGIDKDLSNPLLVSGKSRSITLLHDAGMRGPRSTPEPLAEEESELKKKRNKILASIPRVSTSNPIAAVTNFCRHHLKFDIDFVITDEPSDNPSEPLYTVEVLFPGGEKVGEYAHTRKKYAKEIAAKNALGRINEDEALLEKYIAISFTRPDLESDTKQKPRRQ